MAINMTKVFWTYYIKRFLNNELRQCAVKCSRLSKGSEAVMSVVLIFVSNTPIGNCRIAV